MIKANVAYNMMEKALQLIPSHNTNSDYLSAYGVFNLTNGDCVAVRAANHGTFLYNWLKMQDEPFNIDLLTSANVAITFLDGSIPFTQNNNINMNGGAEPPVFVVRQYVYNCTVLDINDINIIISASQKLITDGVYTDPFEEDSVKHAIIYREKTNEPSKDVTAKTLKRHRNAKRKKENDNPKTENKQYLMNKNRINEIGDTPKGQYMLGQVHSRAHRRLQDLPKDAPFKEMQKYKGIMDDAHSEASCPPNRKVHRKPIINNKGQETTHYGQGWWDYDNAHFRNNENKQYKRNTNMNKKQVRLTESDLKQIVKESIKRILKENDAQKEIEELERQIEEHKYEIERLERKISILGAENHENEAPSAPWTRGPEPYHTRGY